MVVELYEFSVAILAESRSVGAGKVVRVVERVLHEVGGVVKCESGVLGRYLHLDEVGPFSVLIVHCSRRIVEAAHGVDAAGHKQAVAYPAEVVAQVADGTAGLYDLSCRCEASVIDLVAAQAVLLLAHPVRAAEERCVGPFVVDGYVGRSGCQCLFVLSAHVGGEIEVGGIAPNELVSASLEVGEGTTGNAGLCVAIGVQGKDAIGSHAYQLVLEEGNEQEAPVQSLNPASFQLRVFVLHAPEKTFGRGDE